MGAAGAGCGEVPRGNCVRPQLLGLDRLVPGEKAEWSVTGGKAGPAGEQLGTQVGSWLLQSWVPPREAAGVRPPGSEPCLLSPQVGFRHCKDYVAYVWAKHEDVDRNNYQVLKGSGWRGGSPHGLLGKGGCCGYLSDPQPWLMPWAHQVTFSEESLPKGHGDFILGYYSHTHSILIGVTEPFQVSNQGTGIRGAKDPGQVPWPLLFNFLLFF